MAKSADATRAKILASAYRLIRRHGFARTKMNDIAAGAALTKRTLYQHFDSKDALLAAMLAVQHELAVAALVRMTDRSEHDPEHLVETLFADLAAWSSTKHWEGSGFTRLAVELADMPGHPARRMARQHKTALERHLSERLEGARVSEAATVAREILLLLEGTMVMILIHGSRSYADAAARAALRLLQSRNQTGGNGSKSGSLNRTQSRHRRNSLGDRFHPDQSGYTDLTTRRLSRARTAEHSAWWPCNAH